MTSTPEARKGTDSQKLLIGTWRLLSCEAHLADGRILYPFGRNPRGRLNYDQDGNMAGQVMNPDRPHFAAADKSLGSPDEIRRAFAGYEAYFGSYRISDDGVAIHHTIEGALFPNWVGGIQIRFFRLEGRTLELRTADIPYMGTKMVAVLIWERSGAAGAFPTS
jgi:hypothetical protein